MNRNRESLYVNEQLIDTAEITIAFLEQTQQKRLTLDTPTPETQLTPIMKIKPIPDFAIGFILPAENAQQTNQEKLSISESESNF